MLEQHFDEEQAALQEKSMPLIACGEEKVFRYSGKALGVREKIFWVPESRSWTLKIGKEKKNLKDFCRERKLRLSVPPGLTGAEFKAARDKALIDACLAWNSCDGTGKYRIMFPDVTNTFAIKVDACSGFKSDSDSDKCTDDEAGD